MSLVSPMFANFAFLSILLFQCRPTQEYICSYRQKLIYIYYATSKLELDCLMALCTPNAEWYIWLIYETSMEWDTESVQNNNNIWQFFYCMLRTVHRLNNDVWQWTTSVDNNISGMKFRLQSAVHCWHLTGVQLPVVGYPTYRKGTQRLINQLQVEHLSTLTLTSSSWLYDWNCLAYYCVHSEWKVITIQACLE